MSDYYKTLEIDRSASEQEIKTAYRKLALKYHPDRNKGDKAAEEQFKKISEAYAVLSDTEKKRQYDTFGSADFQKRYSSDDIFRGTDFSSIFSDFGGNNGGFDIFSQFFGGSRRTARGQDMEYELSISFDEAYWGAERTIHAGPNKQAISVKIPKGIKEGQKLRITGKGGPSVHGNGQPGDLFLHINIGQHPIFQRKGQDIETPLPIKLTDALLGSSKTVQTLEGQKTVRIPHGVRHGTKLRLKGLGFPITSGSDTRGDFFAVIQVEYPQNLSGAQKEVVEKLQTLGL